MIEPPADKPIYTGEIATYWFEDGLLVSLSNNKQRTVELIARNVAFVQQLTDNKPLPLLIYLTNSPISDKATRTFSTQQLPAIYKAMAMVSKPGLALFIMNLLFKMKPPPIPIKSFSNTQDAKAQSKG